MSNHPQIEELSEHFRLLYVPIGEDGDLKSLRSEVYIPVSDDEISSAEIFDAFENMIKGGYDYPLSCLGLLISVLLLLLFMNLVLLGSYPIQFNPKMSAIPKLQSWT